MIRVALIVVLCAAAVPARAADPDGAAACVRPDTHTVDEIAECLHAVGEAADARLNGTYAKAIASLDPQSADLLRTAERHWVATRDADVQASMGPWRQTRSLTRRIDLTVATIDAINLRNRLLQLYLPD